MFCIIKEVWVLHHKEWVMDSCIHITHLRFMHFSMYKFYFLKKITKSSLPSREWLVGESIMLITVKMK